MGETPISGASTSTARKPKFEIGRLPLAGRVVIDLSQQMPAGYATYLLAEMGAQVIKAEPPWGDALRYLGPGIFDLLSPRKQSVTVDLRSADSRATVRELLTGADAVVVSGRGGSLARHGLDYDGVQELASGIVYCAIGAYDAPNENRPGHDLDVLADSGLLSLIGIEVAPLGVPVVDLATGALAAAAIAASLAGPPRSGARIELTLAAVARSWGAFAMGVESIGAIATAGERPDTDDSAGYGVFSGAGGELFVVCAVEDEFWRRLVAETGLPAEYAAWDIDARREHAEAANVELRTVFRTRTRGEWLEALALADIPAGAVRTAVQVASDAVASGDFVIVANGDGKLRLRFPSATFGAGSPTLSTAGGDLASP